MSARAESRGEGDDDARKETLDERAERWKRLRRGAWKWEHAPNHRDLTMAASRSGRDLSNDVKEDIGALMDAEDKLRRMSIMLSAREVPEPTSAADMIESVLQLKDQLKQKHQQTLVAPETHEDVGLFHLTSASLSAPVRTKSTPPKFDPSKLRSVQRHKAYQENLQKSIQQAREEEEERSQFRARPLPRHFSFPQRRPPTPQLDVDLDELIATSRSEHLDRAPFLQVQIPEQPTKEEAARDKEYYEALELELTAPGNWHQLPMMERQKRWLLRRELKAEQARVECILSPVLETNLGPVIQSNQESWLKAKRLSEQSKLRADKEEDERIELKAMRDRVKLMKQRAHIEGIRLEAQTRMAAVKRMQPKLRHGKLPAVATQARRTSAAVPMQADRQLSLASERPSSLQPDNERGDKSQMPNLPTQEEKPPAPAKQRVHLPPHLDVLRQVDKLIAQKGWTKELDKFEKKAARSPSTGAAQQLRQPTTPTAASFAVEVEMSPQPSPLSQSPSLLESSTPNVEPPAQADDVDSGVDIQAMPTPLVPRLSTSLPMDQEIERPSGQGSGREALRTADRRPEQRLADVLERIHERVGTASNIAPYERAERSGVFFDRSSTQEIGRFRVFDARDFEVTTIQRVADATTGGVKLLVGERKQPENNSEQGTTQTPRTAIITVLFDRRLFDEEAAKSWWQAHKQRLLQLDKPAH